MFSHMIVGSNDIGRSKIFYDALFAALGGNSAIEDGQGRLFYIFDGAVFGVTPPIDGNPATIGNGGTIGFRVASPEQADAWHKAGVEHGGTAIEDAPGLRENAFGTFYLAYLRDPDGNKLCALNRHAG